MQVNRNYQQQQQTDTKETNKNQIKTTFFSLETRQNLQHHENNIELSSLNTRVPVLFSTDRGIYLRTTKLWPTIPEIDDYRIQFCDLEIWSANQRANDIKLDSNSSDSRNNKQRSVRYAIERR